MWAGEGIGVCGGVLSCMGWVVGDIITGLLLGVCTITLGFTITGEWEALINISGRIKD